MFGDSCGREKKAGYLVRQGEKKLAEKDGSEDVGGRGKPAPLVKKERGLSRR